MAKAKNTKVKSAEFMGYHKINLDDKQNALFDEQYASAVPPLSDIDILINNGYKLSFSWDDYNSGVSASLYAKNQKMEWAGYTLSAWAGDAQTALNLLLFKHFIVAKERWEIVKPEREGSSVKWG